MCDETRWALFLDFDGTLVDIAERPDAVVVPPDLCPTLARLRDRLGGALAIVSGRQVAIIDGFLAPHLFDVAGLHGAEHRIAGALSSDGTSDAAIRGAVERLEAALPADPRLIVEDKGGTVAVHWRLAPEFAEQVGTIVDAVAAELGPRYRLQRGKAVAELVPVGATKGTAIARLAGETPYRGRHPVFVGDDLTDEHAFEAVNALGGVSIRIGPGHTVASRRIDSPRALREQLAEWAAGSPIHL